MLNFLWAVTLSIMLCAYSSLSYSPANLLWKGESRGSGSEIGCSGDRVECNTVCTFWLDCRDHALSGMYAVPIDRLARLGLPSALQ